jgi:ArsR family transcriptional regulator
MKVRRHEDPPPLRAQAELTADQGCADKLRVLADRTRLAVVELLIDGPRRFAELNAVLRLEQSLLSHHLQVLREAELVLAERDGREVVYRLASTVAPAADQRAIELGCCAITFESRAKRKRRRT